MKFIRYGDIGDEMPGPVGRNGTSKDLSKIIGDMDCRFLDETQLSELAKIDASSLNDVPAGTRLGPCIARMVKIVCVGLSYCAHALDKTATAVLT